jgi:hypothetical protein
VDKSWELSVIIPKKKKKKRKKKPDLGPHYQRKSKGKIERERERERERAYPSSAVVVLRLCTVEMGSAVYSACGLAAYGSS